MNYPIRENGLQVEAAISMGNSLYAVLIGIIISVITVILSSSGNTVRLFGFSNSGGMSSAYFVCMILVVVLWIMYYILDWHDLNMVLVYDEDIGRKQMFLYFLCILAISLCVVLALLGKAEILGIVASVYVPFAVWLRNKVIDRPPTNATPDEAYEHGKKFEKTKNRTRKLNYLLLLVCVLGFICGICGSLSQVSVGQQKWLVFLIELGKFFNPYTAVVVSAVALFFKYHRSTHKIEQEYHDAVVAMHKASRRDASMH